MRFGSCLLSHRCMNLLAVAAAPVGSYADLCEDDMNWTIVLAELAWDVIAAFHLDLKHCHILIVRN